MADDQFRPDQVRDHSFDGIEEYDNNLPKWWQAIFVISIAYAVFYHGFWHFGPGLLGADAWNAEVAAIEEQRQAEMMARGELAEEDLRTLLTDEGRIDRGKAAYAKANCAQCHLADGKGNIGPNLLDDQFKYGNTMKDMIKTLTYGRKNNQMPAQNKVLTPDEIIDLTVYLVHWNKTAKANGVGHQVEGEVLAPIDY
jgi:cytochrome c oxidase cbb3-type subunit 3